MLGTTECPPVCTLPGGSNAINSAAWAAPWRGCTAPLRSRDAALRQRDKGASSRLCRCQDGAFDLAALPRKSNSMLHASEATATYW